MINYTIPYVDKEDNYTIWRGYDGAAQGIVSDLPEGNYTVDVTYSVYNKVTASAKVTINS